jgi:hypothetical protein
LVKLNRCLTEGRQAAWLTQLRWGHAAHAAVDLLSMLKLKRWLIKVMPFLARWGSNTTPNP